MTRINALKLAAAALLLALGAAACGGSGNTPSVAGSGGSNTTTTSAAPPSSGGGGTSSGGTGGGQARLTMQGGKDATKLSSCMRQHGVPDFPDPSANGTITVTGINPDSPTFQNAMGACAKYTPNGGKAPSPAMQARMQAQALKFSACMRSHGLPNFPDPQFSPGGMSIRITGNAIDPNSPAFKSAQQACAKDLPGRPGTAEAK